MKKKFLIIVPIVIVIMVSILIFVFTRDKLLSSVWGLDHIGESRTVDMHIKTLRKKLGTAGSQIETVIGVGYRMEKKV